MIADQKSKTIKKLLAKIQILLIQGKWIYERIEEEGLTFASIFTMN